MKKKYREASGTYYYVSVFVGKKGGLPPLPSHIQRSVDRILTHYGPTSDEYIILAEKIVFLGGMWMIKY